MRRNGENLLVLAGEEAGRQWNQPVPLVDVLRAAASEVEAYDRIELVGIPETDIHGSAVTDLVHLLAELLENATTFSSPQTKVRVTATRLPDGRVMIEIHDRGIGLTAEDFADINHKLAEPPTVDVEVAKRMGLFVVGRLADRHGIRVQLRPSGEQAGTTSLVMLPEPITHGGGGEEFLADDEDNFTVARVVPEHAAAEAGPGPFRPELAEAGRRSAAELGFDDSRYDLPNVPDDARSLDPVGRSLLREERRAQLEAATADRQDEVELPRQRDEEPQEAEAFGNLNGAGSYDTGFNGFANNGYESNGFENTANSSFENNAFEGNGFNGSQGYEQPYDPAYQQQYQQQTYEQGFQPDYSAQNGYAAPQGYEQPYQQPYDPGLGQPDLGQPGVGQPGLGQNGQNGNGETNGHPAEFTGYSPVQQDWPAAEPEVTESAPPLPQAPSESVVSPSLTDAGLPRRGRRPLNSPEEQPAQETPEPQEPQEPPQPEESDWRSTNDEHWQRAEAVREPKAGGVTPSGLPRRVPKANLVAGAAAQTPQGGPQVSRAPEDVRGRLSNLRRGVQQGRTAGTDTNGQATDSRFGGPQNQER
jgi:hypothetical protein